MASTRNKNTVNDYKLKTLEESQQIAYKSYKHSASGAAHIPALPDFGVGSACRTLHPGLADDNAHDIESELFGIGSTNLVQPKKNVVQKSRRIPFYQYYSHVPMVMPDPLYIRTDQRPSFL